MENIPVKWPMLMLVIGGVLLPPARAHDPGSAAIGCGAFGWDVTRELALMRTPATPVSAGTDSATTASIVTNRHYTVTLPPQEQARFAMSPARPSRDATPRGGSLRFTVGSDGRYRISITSRHWIDVIADGRPVDSAGHQGAGDCALVHKIVEFELRAGAALVLQLSGSADQAVDLAITASPG